MLIVLIGVLNFHPPHFLAESHRSGSGIAGLTLEAVLATGLVAAVVAAAGVYRDRRWAWRLGTALAFLGVVEYVLQETIGLPGLSRNWVEPSRLLTLALEAVFIALASARAVGSAPSAP